MARHKGAAYVYAEVAAADHERIRQLAQRDGMSMSTWVRAAIEDALEAIGEKPLAEVCTRERASSW